MPQAPAQPAAAPSGNVPPQMRGVLALPKILRIGIIQGGKIVEERLVRKRENVTVGQSTKNTFVIPTEALPRSFLLFEVHGHQSYALNFTDGMDGRISLGDQVLSLQQLKEQGRAQRRGHLWHLPLNEKARGKVVVGDATILFQFVAPPPPQPRPQLPPSVRGTFAQTLDWALIALLGLSLLGHFGFVFYLSRVDWPHKPPLDEVPDRFISMIVKAPPKEPEKKQEIIQQGPGEEKKVETKKTVSKNEGNSRPKGPPRTKSPAELQAEAEARARADAERRARLAEQVASMGLLQKIGAKGEGGRVQDLLSNGTPGGDQEKALQGVRGVGEASGGERPGLPGIRGGGSGTGKVAGIGDLRAVGVQGGGTGEKGPERAVKGVVRSEKPKIDGEMDPRGASQVLQDGMAAIKGCYERALKRNDKLGGKLVVSIEISTAGKVTSVEADSDDVGDAEVFGCIKSRIMGWRFPAAKGNSVTVVYPFIFQPASR
jgi:hypothetical protein